MRAQAALATSLQRGKQGAFGDDGGARFGVIELAENFRGFRVFHPVFIAASRSCADIRIQGNLLIGPSAHRVIGLLAH